MTRPIGGLTGRSGRLGMCEVRGTGYQPVIEVRSMNPDDSPDDWLQPRIIECPSCKFQLFQVGHSPFCDDYRLYCNRCPCAIEISFYDLTLVTIQNGVIVGDRSHLMAAIEPRLLPCKCGGRYLDNAPRRCFGCGNAVIVEDAAGIDLSPYFGADFEGRDPTPDEQAKYDQYLEEFVRTDCVWA